MALLLKKMYLAYEYAMTDLTDPRTRGWFLVNSPIQMIFLVVLYLLFVLDFGPKWMEKRQPFKLKKVLMVYNLIQIALNSYIVIMGFPSVMTLSLHCSPIDFSYDPHPLNLVTLTYVYYLVKILDLLDTVFIVLRKKNSQGTFLHIYHHCGMILIGYAGAKYIGGGHSIFLGFINSFVHAVMYTYYLISASYPQYSNIWWKRHITELQLLQFLTLFFIYMPPLLDLSCGFPKFPIMVYVPQNTFMLCMFGDFYYKTYLKKK